MHEKSVYRFPKFHQQFASRMIFLIFCCLDAEYLYGKIITQADKILLESYSLSGSP